MRLKIVYAIASLLIFLGFLSCQICGTDQLKPKQQTSDASKDTDDDHLMNMIIHVGIIVHMRSSVDKVILSCVKMAISDTNNVFYRQNGTRIVLHKRDSKGEPLSAITAAKNLLKRVKVAAIIIPKMTSETSIVASLGDKAGVPILSFTSIPLPTSHPYFLQITEEEDAEFKGIISLLEETFKWRSIVLIHENTGDAKDNLPHLLEKFQEKSIHVIYMNAISLTEEGHQATLEFDKLKTTQTSVFVVHTSPSVASKIFINSNRLGMMSEGYAWVITRKTMNFFDSLDPSVIESMQGALGLKSYIPPSSKLRSFILRWRNEVLQHVHHNLEPRDLNVFGIRAYDTIWALAKSTRSLSTKWNLTYPPDARAFSYGSKFLNEVLRSEFRGLGGDFRFKDGKLVFKDYEVVNVIGTGVRKVGFWTLANGFTKEVSLQGSPMNLGLKTIIWPGLSTNTPKCRRLFQVSGKSLKIGFPKSRFKELLNMQRDIHGNINVTGFCKDVFDAAIGILGYSVPYQLIPFVDTNGQRRGSYDDLIYQVYLKEFDAAIGDITIRSNRSLYVDFTLPYTDFGVGKVAQLNKNTKWFFLKPLDPDLRIMVPCFFILMGVIVWLFEHPINEEFQGSRAQQIGTILWFSISTLVYAHRERLRSNLSKFVVGVWLFVVFIFSSSYTAILSSTLTLQQIQLTKGDYIGFSWGTIGIVNDVVNIPEIRVRNYSSLEDYNNALSKGSKHGGVGAIIDELPYIKIFLSKYPSDHALIDTSPSTNGFGFVFQKGSPLVPEISRAIAKLREDGTLQKLEKKWYINQRNLESDISSDNYEEAQPKTLSLDDFLDLFLLSGVSKIIAVLIFLIFFLRKKLSINLLTFRAVVDGKLDVITKYLFRSSNGERHWLDLTNIVYTFVI